MIAFYALAAICVVAALGFLISLVLLFMEMEQ